MKKDSYLLNAKKLKARGLVNFDLREKLTPARKTTITKIINELGKTNLKNIENIRALKPNANQLKAFKASGFKPINGKIVIPLRDYDSVRLTKGGLSYKGKTRDGQIISEQLYLSNADNFHEQFARLLSRPLKPDELITAQIGDNSPFNYSRFQQYDELLNYLQYGMQIELPGQEHYLVEMQKRRGRPLTKKELKERDRQRKIIHEQLKRTISLVKVTEPLPDYKKQEADRQRKLKELNKLARARERELIKLYKKKGK